MQTIPKILWGGALLTFCSSTLTTAEELECTATPNCETLGYKQTSCSGKGIRCPFDSSKLFCINENAATTPFKFANEIKLWDIVYSDGSTKTTYDSTKTPIGIIVYVHQNGKKNHGIIASLKQPTAQKRDEAIKQCKAFVTKGTQVGNWHLPDLPELSAMTQGNTRTTTNEINQMINRLALIPGADRMGFSGARNYCTTYGAYNVDYTSGSYLNGAPGCNASYYDSYYFWSTSESPTTANQYWIANISSYSAPFTKKDYRNYKGQFRCVATF